ncbi:membrane-associated phospholipid phosphatase [Stakelama sediminis]|uniref:Membrane-associated phospholipid phosphatase n=1 Tax=Stakelama sediminis TaxID=463200 RepID=A0A840Z1X2_9SPHN|nr:phosphatase PAP2 family protein [Stakelama sediminis]MBB5719682.1 membrane-associated phospholipid phosphatase [Stakelama sediminis]
MIGADTLSPPWGRIRTASGFFAQDRRFFDAYTIPLYMSALLGCLLIAGSVAVGRFSLDTAWYSGLGTSFLIFLAISWAMRWAGFPRLAGGVEAILLLMLSMLILATCNTILAAVGLPVRDEALRRFADMVPGYHRQAIVDFVLASPVLSKASGWIYESFAFTPQLLLLWLFVTRRQEEAWTFVTAMIVGLWITALLFMLVPAYGNPPFPFDVGQLTGARDGSLRILNISVMTGLIVFPSYHAAGATMLAWGYRRVGRWGLPLVILNVLMIGSALVWGGHYLADLIAGVLVALASIRISRIMVQRSADISAA